MPLKCVSYLDTNNLSDAFGLFWLLYIWGGNEFEVPSRRVFASRQDLVFDTLLQDWRQQLGVDIGEVRVVDGHRLRGLRLGRSPLLLRCMEHFVQMPVLVDHQGEGATPSADTVRLVLPLLGQAAAEGVRPDVVIIM